MFENGEKEIFFEKNTFQRNFLRTRRKLFWLFNRRSKKLRWKSEIELWKVNLTARIFSLRYFYGHVEGTLVNTWRLFAQFLEKKPVFLKNSVFIRMFFWPFSLEIWQHCRNYFAESRKTFRSMSENHRKKTFFFKKNFFHRIVPMDAYKKDLTSLPVFFRSLFENDEKKCRF